MKKKSTGIKYEFIGMKYDCDVQDIRREGIKLGEKIGFFIGRQKAIREEKIKLVRKMYGKIDINLLAEYTGFSLETIENLVNDDG